MWVEKIIKRYAQKYLAYFIKSPIFPGAKKNIFRMDLLVASADSIPLDLEIYLERQVRRDTEMIRLMRVVV